MPPRKRKASVAAEQGGNATQISKVVSAAADPVARQETYDAPKFLSEAATQASAAAEKQSAGPVPAPATPVATPAKKSRSQEIIDRSSGTGSQLSDSSLKARALGMGWPATSKSVRENRGYYAALPDHFTTGVFSNREGK